MRMQPNHICRVSYQVLCTVDPPVIGDKKSYRELWFPKQGKVEIT
jgi:hypothetical protein